MAAANRAYGLLRGALNGRSALSVGAFRAILRDFGIYDSWKTRTFAYGRRKSTERFRVATITPELAYILGFVCGDGHVQSDDRHSSVHIFQSRVHLPYIVRLLSATKAVTPRNWSMYPRVMRSLIRGRPVESATYHMHKGSNLLAFVYEWLTNSELANVLSLDDEALPRLSRRGQTLDDQPAIDLGDSSGLTFPRTACRREIVAALKADLVAGVDGMAVTASHRCRAGWRGCLPSLDLFASYAGPFAAQ